MEIKPFDWINLVNFNHCNFLCKTALDYKGFIIAIPLHSNTTLPDTLYQ